jgi:alanine racemase
MSRPLYALIDQKALMNNMNIVKHSVHNSKVIAIVKADAYGHGLLNVVNGLDSADAFAVASIEEGIKLRNATDKCIILLEGFFATPELQLIEKYDFQIVLHSFKQLQSLNDNNDFKIKIWLKINTGMNRLGFTCSEAKIILNKFKSYNNKIIGLLTHLACADIPEYPLNNKQIQRFHSIKNKNLNMSMCNSAAILSGLSNKEWSRPGIILYGVSPFNDSLGTDFNLIPVMTLVSEIISIHFFHKGDPIGYGSEYICPQDMLVGVVAVGYGDGYPRNAPVGTPILINNSIAYLIGRVCMDMIMVDLRNCNNIKIGDKVVLWGQGLPIEIISKHLNTIPHELLSGITARVPRYIM